MLFRCYTNRTKLLRMNAPACRRHDTVSRIPLYARLQGRVSTQGKRMMKTNLRRQLLASTLLVGAFAYANPAFAQQAPPPDQPPTQNATSQPPSGPVESQPTPSVSSQGQPVQSGQEIVITGSRIAQPNL